jgi:hypothetical protein
MSSGTMYRDRIVLQSGDPVGARGASGERVAG